MTLGRRAFLGGLGVGAATLALPFARATTARATGRYPTRFVAIHTANGSVASQWATGSGRDFTLGPILRPLRPFREKLLLVKGLDMDVTSISPGGGHQRGIGALLTGQPLLPGDFCGGTCEERSGWAGGISIDQRIARAIGIETRFASLELGVGVRESTNRSRLAYRAANDPIPPDCDPWSVYRRLFADLATDATALDRVRRERRSVIDLVRGDLAELSSRVGADERARLDAHLESLREIERRMDATSMTSAACELPAAPGPRVDPLATASYPDMADLQLDLLAAALACDLTRVATVLMSGATSAQRFPWLGIEETHHSLSHEPDSNAAAQDKLVRINQWYATRVARLLAKLDAIPEGDGTMLDHTVVFWGSELSKGNNHSRDDMTFVVAGSGSGYFRTGRLASYPARQHNDLLVAFGQAMGLDIERFGHRDYTRGVLPGLG